MSDDPKIPAEDAAPRSPIATPLPGQSWRDWALAQATLTGPRWTFLATGAAAFVLFLIALD